MYTVQIEYECSCFKKSDYLKEKSFEKQQDAYNYTNILVEFMNEDFCTSHIFYAQKLGDYAYLIRVADNPNAGGSCSTGSCGPCGCD
ncbi:hypothetical protein N9A28_09915 [Sulfurimonas sp.]|nr:hypothetical protein [Sulfurimonas sp.]